MFCFFLLRCSCTSTWYRLELYWIQIYFALAELLNIVYLRKLASPGFSYKIKNIKRAYTLYVAKLKARTCMLTITV